MVPMVMSPATPIPFSRYSGFDRHGISPIGAIAAAPMSYRVIAKLRHRKLSATLMAPRFTQLVGLTRARGQWRISAAADFYFAIIRSATGRRPRFTQLVGLTRARGRWWIRRRRISISRLSDHDGSDPRRGEVGGRCQSHPGSIDGGVEPPVYSIGWPHARARAVVDSAAADFYFAIIRSRRVGPTAW